MSKRAIPESTRRAVARRDAADMVAPGVYAASCCYCGKAGEIHWGSPSWVYFRNLELDHLHPEHLGGTGDPDNIVLACRRCNRSKGHKTVDEWIGAAV